MAAIAQNLLSVQLDAYGKMASKSSFAVDPRIGWWLMEFPVTVTFIIVFFGWGGSNTSATAPRVLAALFCMHYAYRGWIFPSMMRVHKGTGGTFSLGVAL